MFKLYHTVPTIDDSVEVLCDYMEYRCIVSGQNQISFIDLIKEFVRASDEGATSGINDVQDDIRESIQEVEFEIHRRIESTNSRYPFELTGNASVLRFKGFNSILEYLYIYLLFATRLNMKENKKFDSIDGTLLFESISAKTSEQYFGANSVSHHIGTGTKGGFEAKLEKLCVELNEGLTFENKSDAPITEQDGTLDFITFVDFSDKRPSKLIAFGQSKTGTDWERDIAKLQPQSFCQLWFSRMPAHLPIRMYFIADVPENNRWYKLAVKAGILFDRLRILNYAPSTFEDSIEKQIITWTESAIDSAKPDLKPSTPKKRATTSTKRKPVAKRKSSRTSVTKKRVKSK